MIFMYISDRETEVVKYGRNFLVRYQRFFSFYYWRYITKEYTENVCATCLLFKPSVWHHNTSFEERKE